MRISLLSVCMYVCVCTVYTIYSMCVRARNVCVCVCVVVSTSIVVAVFFLNGV